jgi:hypothetical protein
MSISTFIGSALAAATILSAIWWVAATLRNIKGDKS